MVFIGLEKCYRNHLTMGASHIYRIKSFRSASVSLALQMQNWDAPPIDRYTCTNCFAPISLATCNAEVTAPSCKPSPRYAPA